MRPTPYHLSLLLLALRVAGAPAPALAQAAGDPEDEPEATVEPLRRVDSPVAPDSLTLREILDPNRAMIGSLSLGTTSNGGLHSPALVPVEGESHFILPEHRGRPTHYGTDEMVALLLDAAQQVNRQFPDTRLAVGNLSVVDGGRIPWSRSHNAGRDADVGFYFKQKDGKPYPMTTLVRARYDGRARDIPGARDVAFDVERNWAFVRALLESKAASVQWIFIYAPLRRQLLAHAQAKNEPAELLERAAAILHQPSDSAPHDDHFHIRIYCPLEDRLEGCQNTGPARPWVDLHDREFDARVRTLLRGTASDESQLASAAAARLLRMKPAAHLDLLADAVMLANPAAQVAMLRALLDTDTRRGFDAVLPLAESSADPEVRLVALRLALRTSSTAGVATLLRLLRDDRTSLRDGAPVRLFVLDGLAGNLDERLAPGWIAALSDDNPTVRRAAGRRLSHLTGLSHPVDPARPLTAEQRRRLADHWNAWWAQHGGEGREKWVTAGFDAAFPRARRDRSGRVETAALVRATQSGIEGVSFNASLQLARRTGKPGPSIDATPQQRFEHWTRATRHAPTRAARPARRGRS